MWCEVPKSVEIISFPTLVIKPSPFRLCLGDDGGGGSSFLFGAATLTTLDDIVASSFLISCISSFIPSM